VPVAQPRWLNVVTSKDIHHTRGTPKIGPSRRRIADRQQSMRLRSQNLARKIYGGHQPVRGFQFVVCQSPIDRQNNVRNLGAEQIEEGARVSDGHKRVPEAAAA